MPKDKDIRKQTNTDKEIIYESENDEDVFCLKKDKVKIDLENCRKERQEFLDGWQRSRADFINLKKRVDEEKKELVKYATEEFILKLLPALDSFDQAFKNKESWEKAPPDWRIGIESIYSQIKNILTEHGVLEINPIGEIFDPTIHNSLTIVDVEKNEEDGKIAKVIQKGYRLGDKIIKHPNVTVGKKK